MSWSEDEGIERSTYIPTESCSVRIERLSNGSSKVICEISDSVRPLMDVAAEVEAAYSVMIARLEEEQSDG